MRKQAGDGEPGDGQVPLRDLKPGTRVRTALSGVEMTLVEKWPQSAVVSFRRAATVPDGEGGRREVESTGARHVSLMTMVVVLALPTRESREAAQAAYDKHKRQSASPKPSPMEKAVAESLEDAMDGPSPETRKPEEKVKTPPAREGGGVGGWCEVLLLKMSGVPYKEIAAELKKQCGEEKSHKWVANVAFKMRKEGRLK